jgi:Arc/MetJ family transcription regulator
MHDAREGIMRTTLNLNDEIVKQAMEMSPGKSKTAVINEALREYARRRRLEGYRSLAGRFHWEGSLDDLRRRRPARR